MMEDNSIQSLTDSQSLAERKSEQRQSKPQKSSSPLTDIPENPLEDRNSTGDQELIEASSKSRVDNPCSGSDISAESTEITIESLHTSKRREPKTRSTYEPIISAKAGPHISLFSVICLPAAFIASLCVSFYFGASTWYNIYLYFSEEKTIWHKVSICPVLILTFPFTIGFTSLGVAVFGAFVQLSWFYESWRTEFLDFEKGFYGWLCNKCGLPQCCPYEIITLNDESELEPMRTSL